MHTLYIDGRVRASRLLWLYKKLRIGSSPVLSLYSWNLMNWTLQSFIHIQQQKKDNREIRDVQPKLLFKGKKHIIPSGSEMTLVVRSHFHPSRTLNVQAAEAFGLLSHAPKSSLFSLSFDTSSTSYVLTLFWSMRSSSRFWSSLTSSFIRS